MPIELFVYNQKIGEIKAEKHSLYSSIFNKIMYGSDQKIYNEFVAVIKKHPFTQKPYHQEQLQYRSGKISFILIDSDVGKTNPFDFQEHSIGYSKKLTLVPLLENMSFGSTPHFIPILPITLSYGEVRIPVPEGICSISTTEELRDYINSHPELQIYPKIISEIQKDTRSRRLFESNALVLDKEVKEQNKPIKLKFVNAITHELIEDYYPSIVGGKVVRLPTRLGCEEIMLAPAFSDQLEQLILPHEKWLDPENVTLDAVCTYYLGKFPDNLEQYRNQSIINFCQFQNWDHLFSIEAELAISDIATAIAYYCKDNGHIELLSSFPLINQYSRISMENSQIYDGDLPDVGFTQAERADGLAVADELLKGLSSSQRFSFLRSRNHDGMLRALGSKILFCYEQKIEFGQAQMSNLLLSSLQEEAQKTGPKFNHKGRTAKTIAATLKLAQEFPPSNRFTYYHTTFFSGAPQAAIKKLLEHQGILPDLSNMILGYLGNNSYFNSFFSIPPDMLGEMIAIDDVEFNDLMVTRSCEKLLTELHISPQMAQGMIVDRDRLHEQLNEMKSFPQRYLYFALPTRDHTDPNEHAVTVVIDHVQCKIYCIDSKGDLYGALSDALVQLVEVAKEKGACPGYIILYPRKGAMMQQIGDNLFRPYFVSHVIGLITQLEGINISSQKLGIELAKLLETTQMDLNNWLQPPIDIDVWKRLIALTSLNPDEIEKRFIKTWVSNSEKAMRMDGPRL